ncbi:MAG: NUDIX hydrolase [Anaerolineaceae bacterium]|nr:NUDIX hydrolase [Anaerolineaceae bacterium]
MIEKVTAFIIRPGKSGSDILIFEHPRAGVQLPAGTVELGESPEDALIREVLEETGLRQIEIIKKIAVDHQFTDPDLAILTQTMRCFSRAAQTAQRTGPLFTRGMWVKIFERKVGFTHINYEETDLNQKPPKLLEKVDGWLPSEFLTHELTRHFYLLHVLEETTESWQIRSDRGNIFRLHWVPLNPKPVLIEAQDSWLDYLDLAE